MTASQASADLLDGSPGTAGPEHAAAITLVSHALCPYVQRAAIVLAEKGVVFERREVDLSAKPAWFLAISPLGKTPVLLARGVPIFESAVICEYLDETIAPRLHPDGALDRARHRGWVELASQALNEIAKYYNAGDDAQLVRHRSALAAHLGRVEAALGTGPFFAGERFSIVDAAFAPVFRYFEVFERVDPATAFFDDLPKVQAWRRALAARPSVRRAVADDYAERLAGFLHARHSALSGRMAAVDRRALNG